MNRNLSARFIALLAFSGVIIQFIASLGLVKDHQYGLMISRFFSYFTILTNLLCGCYMVLFLTAKQESSFWRKPETGTAITVYILVVGLIYQFVLRGLVEMKGLAQISDLLTHTITPLTMLLFWLFFTVREKISWSKLYLWVAYPAVYLMYTLAHGQATNWYPYPFVNVDTLGLTTVLRNSSFVLLLFLFLSILLLTINRFFIKNNLKQS